MFVTQGRAKEAEDQHRLDTKRRSDGEKMDGIQEKKKRKKKRMMMMKVLVKLRFQVSLSEQVRCLSVLVKRERDQSDAVFRGWKRRGEW